MFKQIARTINAAVNTQALRGFTYFPALGWREVNPDCLMPRFNKKNHIPLAGKFDISTVVRSNENGVYVIYALIKCNRNKKDTNWVSSELNRIRKDAYADLERA